jgi:hypothetical protein
VDRLLLGCSKALVAPKLNRLLLGCSGALVAPEVELLALKSNERNLDGMEAAGVDPKTNGCRGGELPPASSASSMLSSNALPRLSYLYDETKNGVGQQAHSKSAMAYEKIQERKVENGTKTLKKTMDSRALELKELRTQGRRGARRNT